MVFVFVLNQLIKVKFRSYSHNLSYMTVVYGPIRMGFSVPSVVQAPPPRSIAARTNYAELIHQRHYHSRFLSLVYDIRQLKYTFLNNDATTRCSMSVFISRVHFQNPLGYIKIVSPEAFNVQKYFKATDD